MMSAETSLGILTFLLIISITSRLTFPSTMNFTGGSCRPSWYVSVSVDAKLPGPISLTMLIWVFFRTSKRAGGVFRMVGIGLIPAYDQVAVTVDICDPSLWNQHR